MYVDNQKDERHEHGEVTEFEEVDTETGEIKQDEPSQEPKSELEF